MHEIIIGKDWGRQVKLMFALGGQVAAIPLCGVSFLRLNSSIDLYSRSMDDFI